MNTQPKKCFLCKTYNTHKFRRNRGLCVFNIVFGTEREGGLLRGESTRPKALLKTSCGFIELFCDNIVP